MNLQIRAYLPEDIPSMTAIWNEVVEEGIAFPQQELLDEHMGFAFFAEQTYCGVAEDTASGSFSLTLSSVPIPTPVISMNGWAFSSSASFPADF